MYCFIWLIPESLFLFWHIQHDKLSTTDAELLFQLAMLGGGGYLPKPGTVLTTTVTTDAGTLTDTFLLRQSLKNNEAWVLFRAWFQVLPTMARTRGSYPLSGKTLRHA